MSSLKKDLLERLWGRVANATRNANTHPDPEARRDAAVRAKAYECAISDVESLFLEEARWTALAARELFPTEESRKNMAAALGIPVEFLFPKPPP